MNKNLINNLNEENKKPKITTTGQTQQLLMISNLKNNNCSTNNNLLSKAKSLSNLTNSDNNRLHFVGEQETLV